MNELVLKRLTKMRKEDRRALIDAARDVLKGTHDPTALAIAEAVCRLTA